MIYIFFKSQGIKVGPVYGINLYAPPLRFGNSYYRLCTTTACFREVLPFVIATCHFSLSTQLNASTLANAYKQLALVSRTISTVRNSKPDSRFLLRWMNILSYYSTTANVFGKIIFCYNKSCYVLSINHSRIADMPIVHLLFHCVICTGSPIL